jgi:hypothetical protein
VKRAAVSVRARRAHALRFSYAVTLLCFAETALEHAFGGEPPDKSRYNLFHPTPDALLREMATDRPDKTESAYTVDAGHFQIEMDLLNYSRDRSNAGGAHQTVKALSIAPINVKVGLFNNVDLQFLAQTYNIQWTNNRDANRRTRASGFGDVLLRCKTNLWGNDGGATALSVMPFVKFPTNQDHLRNRALEGGVIFPFALELPGEWELGAQTELDHLQNSDDSDYHHEVVNTITIGHNIIGKLAGYLEFFSNISSERNAKWIATFDFGFTYAVTRDIRLDAGVNVGITEAADDLNPFVGLSVRY